MSAFAAAGVLWAITALAVGLAPLLELEGSPLLTVAQWTAIIITPYLALRFLLGAARS